MTKDNVIYATTDVLLEMGERLMQRGEITAEQYATMRRRAGYE